MRYLAAAPDAFLFYNGSPHLLGFSDSDWASTNSDFSSISAYMFILAGAPVSWKLKKQRTIATSFTEAEYYALSESVKECIFLVNVLEHSDFPVNLPVNIAEDNAACITLAQNPSEHINSKHILVRYHFVRQFIQQNLIHIQQVSTKNQFADLLTKGHKDPNHFQTLLIESGLHFPSSP